MHTRVIRPKGAPELLVRPLRHGDVRTVLALFSRLGDGSRRSRFNGPKPCLGVGDLRQLARVGPTRHALVAFVEGDPLPVALAELVRSGRSAEVAFAVADEYQQRGIGSALAAELLADARAAGIEEIVALVASDNPAVLALLRRTLGRLELRLEGPDVWVRAAVA